MRIIQNALLTWLDANINESNNDCQNTISHLRRVMNTINTFTNGDQCIEFLEGIQDAKVCMVISGSLGKHIVPRVHDMSQVDSIFIFCGNKQYHEQWAKDWSKVKGVCTDIKLICDALKQSAKDCEPNATDFSLVATGGGGGGGDSSNMNLDRLDPMFMYTQITKEILLLLKLEQQHILNFTRYCREVLVDNQQELNNVDKLKRNYHKRTPIYWYTWESFLCPMFNRELRLSDMDLIAKMGFFIGDLHRQIEEFQKISKTLGGLIAFNSFLSTIRNESVSTGFVEHALSDPKMVGILFKMKIHPKQSTAPFASVAEVGAFGNKEDEILFALHTVFRIREIQHMDGNTRLFRVKLELNSDNHKDLQMLIKRIRKETYVNERGWGRLGLVLWKLGKPKQAKEIYRILLKQESDESQMGYIYGSFGLCKANKAEYDEPVRLYQKSITIYEKYYPNSPALAKVYSNIGNVYDNMKNYSKVYSVFEKAMKISEQSLTPNHPDVKMYRNNLDRVKNKL